MMMIRELNGQKSPPATVGCCAITLFIVFLFFFYNILVYFFVSMAMASSVYMLPGRSHRTLPIKLFSVSNLILEDSGCGRFTLASNKTSLNSFREPMFNAPACQAKSRINTHTHMYRSQTWGSLYNHKHKCVACLLWTCLVFRVFV